MCQPSVDSPTQLSTQPLRRLSCQTTDLLFLCGTPTVQAMLAVVEHGGAEERLPAPAFLARLLPVLDTFMPLLANYIKNGESEMSCLRALEVSGGETRMGRGGGCDGRGIRVTRTQKSRSRSVCVV